MTVSMCGNASDLMRSQQQHRIIDTASLIVRMSTRRARAPVAASVAAVAAYAVAMLCAAPHAALARPSPTPSESIDAASADGLTRTMRRLDDGWRFLDVTYGPHPAPAACNASSFPIPMDDKQCLGLTEQAQVTSAVDCRASCCQDVTCAVWQWCPAAEGQQCAPQNSCWTGPMGSCIDGKGWNSSARHVDPPPPPPSPGACTDPQCQPGYDDSAWAQVQLPHDFVLLHTFSESSDKSHGYLPYGKAWYRLNFSLPSGWEGSAFWVYFEATNRAAQVWVNGAFAGTHQSAYTSWHMPLGAGSGFNGTLSYGDGATNVMAVYVDATEPEGWWYDGGGIYRHVWLEAADSLHVEPWGVYAPAVVDTGTIMHSQPDAQGHRLGTGNANVMSSINIVNDGISSRTFTVSASISPSARGYLVGDASTRAGGWPIASGQFGGGAPVTLAAGATTTVNITLPMTNASLWSPDTPVLYTFTTTLAEASTGDRSETRARAAPAIDAVDVTFGVRSVYFDPDKGLLLNGQHIKTKGMANHQDFAGVGVAVPDSLEAFRVATMKQYGANMWRTSHNPANPELLDNMDSQGLMGWCENHRNLDTPDFVADLKGMIMRDRNHPACVLWSICNEALCMDFDDKALRVLKPIVKALDPLGERPVTAAMNGGYTDPFSHDLDVIGVNYNIAQYDSHHKAYPKQPIISSESSSDFSDRGIYANNETTARVTAYDTQYPGWGATCEDSWCAIAERDFVAGAAGRWVRR